VNRVYGADLFVFDAFFGVECTILVLLLGVRERV
jgi:hypothetical protein